MGDCNVKCSSLTNTNIGDDCDCAKLIYKRHGFDAWYGWVNGCKGKDTSSYLAYEMIHTHGFASGSISEWICLIEHESGYNTAAKGGPNYDASYDWGLFQVNDYYWCSGSGQASKYNDCNVKCSSLTNTNIGDDCDCAKLIYKRH